MRSNSSLTGLPSHTNGKRTRTDFPSFTTWSIGNRNETLTSRPGATWPRTTHLEAPTESDGTAKPTATIEPRVSSSIDSTITDTTITADACRQLSLTGLAPALYERCTQATRRRLSHSTFLAEALQIELDIHRTTPLPSQPRSPTPTHQDLVDFDLDANPNIDART